MSVRRKITCKEIEQIEQIENAERAARRGIPVIPAGLRRCVYPAEQLRYGFLARHRTLWQSA